MSELLERIRSRGHWKAIVRPTTFIEKRVEQRSDLLPILEKNAVEIKGWSFPHVDQVLGVDEGPDWVGQELARDHILEFWRFYQSGQFIHYCGMPEDWATRPSPWLQAGDEVRRVMLDVGDVVIRFAEIFEFAARLAFTQAWDEGSHIKVVADNIDNHFLQLPDLGYDKVARIPQAGVPKMQYAKDFSREELIATAGELALEPALQLFNRFGWKPGINVIRDLQTERVRRGSLAMPQLRH